MIDTKYKSANELKGLCFTVASCVGENVAWPTRECRSGNIILSWCIDHRDVTKNDVEKGNLFEKVLIYLSIIRGWESFCIVILVIYTRYMYVKQILV